MRARPRSPGPACRRQLGGSGLQRAEQLVDLGHVFGREGHHPNAAPRDDFDALAASAGGAGAGEDDGDGEDGTAASTDQIDGTLTLATATDPLPSPASADDIERAAGGALGPVDDVAVEMARFGPFPVVPTPDGASIIRFNHELQVVRNAEETVAVRSWVVLDTPQATVDEMVLFYETSLAQAGWTRSSFAEEDAFDEGEKNVEIGFTIPDVESGLDEPVALFITDEVGGETTVGITFTQWVDRSTVDLDRWLDWPGDTPFPDGGRVARVGVEVRSEVAYLHTVRYDELDADAVIPEVEGLVAGSDYSVDPAGNPIESILALTHPDFDRGEISFTSRAVRMLDLTMFRDLP